jgi:hypothetical protein
LLTSHSIGETVLTNASLAIVIRLIPSAKYVHEMFGGKADRPTATGHADIGPIVPTP